MSALAAQTAKPSARSHAWRLRLVVPAPFLGWQRWSDAFTVVPVPHLDRNDPVRLRKISASPLKLKSGDNSFGGLPRLGRLSFDPALEATNPDQGAMMAKRKKRSKVQKQAKPRRGNSATRGKARRAKAAKAAKRTIAKAKPKGAPVKKAARKIVAPVVETIAVEVIEQTAPGVVTVTEVEETEIRKAS